MTYYLKLRPFILMALMLCIGALSQAQTPKLYTTSEGLSSTRIQQLAFDQSDFLWISTDLGLCRFDGQTFSYYQGQKDTPHHLQESNIICLYVDDMQQHWVGASDGLYYMCRTQNSFTRYSINPNRSDISVSSIVQHPLRPHCLIVGTRGWGVHVFDTESRTFDAKATDELFQLLGTLDTPYLITDPAGRLWVTHRSWLSVIDLHTLQSVPVTSSFSASEQTRVMPENLLLDAAHNRLFIGTMEHGLLSADLQTMHVSHVDAVKARCITSLAMSADGFPLIGTEGEGFHAYNPEIGFSFPIEVSGPVDLNHSKIHSIAIDAQQNIWLGLYQKGVLKIPSRNSIFECVPVTADFRDARNLSNVSDFVSLPDGRRVYALDGEGIVMIGPGFEVRHYTRDNSALTSNAVMNIQELPDGRLLIGTYTKGIFVLDTKGTISRDPSFAPLDNTTPRDFALDTQHQILYIGTNGNGLYSYDLNSQRLSHLSTDSDGINWISTIWLDSHGRLWVGLADHLKWYDTTSGSNVGEEDRAERYHRPLQPASAIVVVGYVEDEDHKLWMASSDGLMRYDESSNQLVNVANNEVTGQEAYAGILRSPDGLLWLSSSGCITAYDPRHDRFTRYLDPAISATGTMSNRAAIVWPDGSFSFGGDNGALTFSPKAVVEYHRPERPLCLTRLWVDNITTDYDPSISPEDNVLDQALWCATQLRLPASKASFSLAYSLQDYTSTTGIAYSHRLKGYEEDWHENHGNEMMANYQSLPPGHYTLQIRAQQDNSNSGDYAVTRDLEVIIVAPWYATAWAKCLWLLLAASLITFLSRQVLIRKRERRHLREAELSRQAKEEKLNMLTSVSHEIKTPLTLIISPLRKLLNRNLDTATHTVLETMYRNSLHILKLVNQQMDVRKLDSGQLRLQVQEVGMRSFLGDIMQYFSNAAISRHINYTLQLPAQDDEMELWFDPNQLDKAVLNLLSNAFKFTPDAGEIRIDVATQDDAAQPSATITIYNSGSQLPPEQQAKAFSGIGLSLAREITELHSGSLTVENRPDGVAFCITLLQGNGHYDPEWIVEQSEPVETEEKEYAADTATAEQDDNDRQLVEQLNEELRAKQRLRERRSNLSFDYTQISMSSADEKLMNRVVDVIHKNMSDSDFSVETLAEEVGISRVHLNRKMKELIDTSPSSLIKSVRMKQAAYLLVQSNVTVAEVAYSVGFSSPAYFTSNFSQYFGMTPKEFTSAYTENPDSQELKQLLEQ